MLLATAHFTSGPWKSGAHGSNIRDNWKQYLDTGSLGDEFMQMFIHGIAADFDLDLDAPGTHEKIWDLLKTAISKYDSTLEAGELKRWYSVWQVFHVLLKVWSLKTAALVWSKWQDGENPFDYLGRLLKVAPLGAKSKDIKEGLKHHQPDIALRTLMDHGYKIGTRSLVCVFRAPRTWTARAVLN